MSVVLVDELRERERERQRQREVAVLLCRVDAMYSFFIQWSPNVTGDGEVDVNDRGFVVLRSADSGAPATDSTELPPTNHPGREWHVRSSLCLCVVVVLPSIETIRLDRKFGCRIGADTVSASGLESIH